MSALPSLADSRDEATESASCQPATYRHEKSFSGCKLIHIRQSRDRSIPDPISGQFRGHLNTARCVPIWSFENLDCRETQTLCSNNRLAQLRTGGPTILKQLSDYIEHAPLHAQERLLWTEPLARKSVATPYRIVRKDGTVAVLALLRCSAPRASSCS